MHNDLKKKERKGYEKKMEMKKKRKKKVKKMMQVQMYNIYVYMGFYFTGMTKKIREKREVGRLEEEV